MAQRKAQSKCAISIKIWSHTIKYTPAENRTYTKYINMVLLVPGDVIHTCIRVYLILHAVPSAFHCFAFNPTGRFGMCPFAPKCGQNLSQTAAFLQPFVLFSGKDGCPFCFVVRVVLV